MKNILNKLKQLLGQTFKFALSKVKAFSMVELMATLVMVSVVTAASIPVINSKLKSTISR